MAPILAGFGPAAALSAVGTFLGIVGVLGAAFAVLRSTVTARTVELWKANSDALEHRLSAVEDERDDALAHVDACELELEHQRARIAKLEEDQRTLAAVIGGAVGEEARRTIQAMAAAQPPPRPARPPRPPRPRPEAPGA